MAFGTIERNKAKRLCLPILQGSVAMKIYNKLVIDMQTDEVLYEDSEEYSGDIAYCGGSGGGGDVEGAPDFYYRRKMDIAERQTELAEDRHQFWKEHEAPFEEQKIEANKELLPQQTDLKEQKMDVEGEGLNFKSDKLDVQQEGLGLQSDLISKKKGIINDMGSLGVDARMNQAEADVTQQFHQNQEEARRSMSRMGVDPTSGKFQEMEQDMAIEKASAEAGARNKARMQSKQAGLGLMGGN